MNTVSIRIGISVLGLCLLPLVIKGQAVLDGIGSGGSNASFEMPSIADFGKDTLDTITYTTTLRSSQKDLAKNLAKALKSKDETEILGALRLIAYSGNQEFDRDVAKHIDSEHEEIAEQALNTLVSLASDNAVKTLYKEWTKFAKKEPEMLPALAEKLANMPANEDMVEKLLTFAKNKRISEDTRNEALGVSQTLLKKVRKSSQFEDAAGGLDLLKELSDKFTLRGKDHKHSEHNATLLLPGTYGGSPDYVYIGKNLVIPARGGINVDLRSFIRSDEGKGIQFEFNALLEGSENASATITVYFADFDSVFQLNLRAQSISTSGSSWARPLIGEWVNIRHDFMPFQNELLDNVAITIDRSHAINGTNGRSVMNLKSPALSYMTITVSQGSLTISPGEITEIGMLP